MTSDIEVLRLLSSSDKYDQILALMDIARCQKHQFDEKVIEYLRSHDDLVAIAAMFAHEKLGNIPTDIDLLIDSLTHEDEETRVFAVEVLSNFGPWLDSRLASLVEQGDPQAAEIGEILIDRRDDADQI